MQTLKEDVPFHDDLYPAAAAYGVNLLKWKLRLQAQALHS